MENWIQTYHGGSISLENPNPDDIQIEDIAHALSLICRFTGHVKQHYSVAEHCVLQATYAMNKTRDKNLALWGLLHDAPEAYLGDVSTPLKSMLPHYKVLEDNMMDVIGRKYGLWSVDVNGNKISKIDDENRQLFIPRYIKDLDASILLNERNQLLKSYDRWEVDDTHEPLQPLPHSYYGEFPFGEKLPCWSPQQAKDNYLSIFKLLTACL